MTDSEPFRAHPAIEPLSFLLGRWEGFGKGDYPTIEPFDFIQEVTFSHVGKPFLIYQSRSWRKVDDDSGQAAKGQPLGMETGFWRPQPDGGVEVVLAHPTGITEIYLGHLSGTRIEMSTDAVARTATAKPVTAGKRLYGLVDSPARPGEKNLAYAYDMAAMSQPLQPHLWAQLEWTWTGLPRRYVGTAPGTWGKAVIHREWQTPGRLALSRDRLDKAGQPGGPVYAKD